MNSERLVECEDEVYEKVTFVSLILILFTAGWCAGAERMRIGYSSISGSYLESGPLTTPAISPKRS
ncbi:MAG TPA: hypothetical protein VKH62_08125, partial [Candidatus Binatia bacterium]|nr:hypothetical protein [Candidatus Binatia bacterium]